MKPFSLSLLSGILIGTSFPARLFGWALPDLGPLAWVGLIPLFLALEGVSPQKAWRLSFVTAAVSFGISISWIETAVVVYGGLSVPIGILLNVLLVIYCAAYIALAPFAAKLILKHRPGEGLLWYPACWTAIEYCRGVFPFEGFPWSHLAMSQAMWLMPIQIADLVGVSGVIFLIVWVNRYGVELLLHLRGGRDGRLVAKTVLTFFLVSATLFYGWQRERKVSEESMTSPMLKVGLLQGNISQHDKWKEEHRQATHHIFLQEARKLQHTDLIVWPEASFPYTFPDGQQSVHPSLLGLERQEGRRTPFTLVGALTEYEGEKYANSAWLFDASGERRGVYHKLHLVPFGEYVPYPKLFSFAQPLVGMVPTFEVSGKTRTLSLDGVQVAPLICYEDIFPHATRKAVLEGAHLLVNITNDAWYGWSAAASQHLSLSIFRAVESRRSLVRSTNTGVSAIVMPTGNVVSRSPLFEQLILAGSVPLVSEITPYVRYGDWFAWGCIGYLFFGIVFALFVRLKSRRHE